MPDAWRLAVGTLTRVPVPAPRAVDRRTAGRAMSLAPVVGLLIGLVAALAIWLAGLLAPAGTAGSAVTALLAVGAIAVVTRALHLDGLADTADALGSGKPAAAALEIARRSDIGPFGVLALVFAVGLQASALTVAIERGVGGAAVVFATVTARIALAWACTPLLPAARADGLGAVVAGSVPVPVAAGWTASLVLAAAVLCPWWVLAGVAAGAVAGVLLRTTRHRLGGVTGDVLGAVVEVTSTTALVAVALLPA